MADADRRTDGTELAGVGTAIAVAVIVLGAVGAVVHPVLFSLAMGVGLVGLLAVLGYRSGREPGTTG